MKLVDVISSDLARLEKNVTLKSFFKQYFFPRGGYLGILYGLDSICIARQIEFHMLSCL